MKRIRIPKSEKIKEIPRFWTEEWLADVTKKLDVSKMSPRQKALYHIGMARQMSIIYRFQKEKDDAINAAIAEANREKAQLLKEIKEKEAQLLKEIKEKEAQLLKEIQLSREARSAILKEPKLPGEAEEKEAQLLENMEKQQKEGILKALKSSKLSVEEIAEYFNVSLSYVIALKKEMI